MFIICKFIENYSRFLNNILLLPLTVAGMRRGQHNNQYPRDISGAAFALR